MIGYIVVGWGRVAIQGNLVSSTPDVRPSNATGLKGGLTPLTTMLTTASGRSNHHKHIGRDSQFRLDCCIIRLLTA